MKLPLLYSAASVGPVKILKITITDFLTKFPREVCQAMEVKTMEKMDWIKERLQELHSTRKKISKMDI